MSGRLGFERGRVASLAYLALLVGLAAFALFQPPVSYLRLLGTILQFVVLAESWNILGGYTGYISFGHVTFFGIGAYVSAVLFVRLGWPPYASVIPAGLAAALFALV